MRGFGSPIRSWPALLLTLAALLHITSALPEVIKLGKKIHSLSSLFSPFSVSHTFIHLNQSFFLSNPAQNMNDPQILFPYHRGCQEAILLIMEHRGKTPIPLSSPNSISYDYKLKQFEKIYILCVIQIYTIIIHNAAYTALSWTL